MSNGRWEELLGADVNNLNHLPLTYGLSKSMVRNLRNLQPGLLNPREEEILQIAALIHDWAEAIIGDINYNDKTLEDEAEEMMHLAAILDQYYGEDVGDLRIKMLDDMAVVKDPNSKLGRIFNTIERVGYVRTALRASEHVHSGTAVECENALRWLAVDVLGNHPPVLIERSKQYAPVGLYLRNQAAVINRAFYGALTETFANYEPHEQQAKEAAFIASHEAWQTFIRH